MALVAKTSSVRFSCLFALEYWLLFLQMPVRDISDCNLWLDCLQSRMPGPMFDISANSCTVQERLAASCPQGDEHPTSSRETRLNLTLSRKKFLQFCTKRAICHDRGSRPLTKHSVMSVVFHVLKIWHALKWALLGLRKIYTDYLMDT